MKKNLRIVSAAAAALLAVAPVAASAVSTANAAAQTQITLPGTSSTDTKGDVTLSSNLQAVTYPEQSITDNNTGARYDHMWNGKIDGTVTASYKGVNYSVNLGSKTATAVWQETKNNQLVLVKPNAQGKYRLEPGKAYYVSVSNVSINLGTANAGIKALTLGGNGQVFFNPEETAVDVNTQTTSQIGNYKSTLEAATNQNGGVYVTNKDSNLGDQFNILVKVIPTDVTNASAVHFYDRATNTLQTAGSLNLTAVNGKLNVQNVLNAANAKYAAHQETYNDSTSNPSKNHQYANNGNYTNSGAHVTTTVADLTAQLTKQGISVDSLGNFEAPANFTFNLEALSDANKATASLPITVTVPNGTPVNNSTNEVTTKKTIMHIAAVYGKDGKKLPVSTLRAYDEYDFVSTPVTINGKKYYKLAGKDQYVKASNIDGYSKTLKKNSYIYKRSATTNKFSKVKNYKSKKKLAGSSVTVYGSKMYNGSWYRIGKNQYIRARNF